MIIKYLIIYIYIYIIFMNYMFNNYNDNNFLLKYSNRIEILSKYGIKDNKLLNKINWEISCKNNKRLGKIIK